MALERQDIEKKDFPTVRRGYDPGAVAAHLRAVADEMESLQRSSSSRSDSLSSAASGQVRQIVEAAENTASEIRQQAADQGREHVARVSQSAQTMIDRVDALEGELSALIETLRTGGNRLTADLALLEGNMSELRSAAGDESAAPAEAVAVKVEEIVAVEAEDEPERDDVLDRAVDGAGDDDAEPEPATATPSAEAAPSGGGDDAEGARLIALNMALNGTPREETDRYLAENFELDNRAGLLDEVYERVGG